MDRKLHSDGYNEGYFKGQILGEMEGFALGVERGKSFAQEVGFYDGFVSTLMTLYEQETKSIRLMKVLKKMKTKLDKIQGRTLDPQNQELFDDLEDIRSKFKQVSSMIDATPTYGGTSGTTDMSF
eukprot:Seg3553.2 transcript_id=Seg3553.2/GoldUCD/mRNA.D3Y31 product="Oral cancer-overexpressed protein 1" protein_id=Seg3553.2/GoldUCD/D3Y31